MKSPIEEQLAELRAGHRRTQRLVGGVVAAALALLVVGAPIAMAGGLSGGGLQSNGAAASVLVPGATGTDLTLSGALNVTGAVDVASGAGVSTLLVQARGASVLDVAGGVADSAGNVAIRNSSRTTMTAGMDRYIQSFSNDFGTTARGRVASNGTYLNTAAIGTAASGTGVTATYSGASPHWLHKVTILHTAMTAAATTDITLAVTPVNSRIVRIKADVTTAFTGGALSAVTMTCGNAAGGNQYLLSGNVFAAAIVLGDVVAEMGAGVVSATLADFGTAAAGTSGALTVSCRFTCTTANCNAATAGVANLYVEGVTYF